MVTIQPFEYEKTTAFKERVQIANKVNEIINLFNELDIESKINVFNEEIAIINTKITEIDNAINEVNTAVNTVEGYNTRLTSVENGTVKLSGNQTIEDIKTYTKSPIVPNPPNGDTSTKAVNTNWISQTGDNAPNNLIHKNGDETKKGKLTLNDGIIMFNETWETVPITVYKWNLDSTIPPTKFVTINGGFAIKDVNNREMWEVRAYRDTDGRDVLSIDGFAYDNTSGYIHIEIGPNGYRKIRTNFDKPSNW